MSLSLTSEFSVYITQLLLASLSALSIYGLISTKGFATSYNKEEYLKESILVFQFIFYKVIFSSISPIPSTFYIPSPTLFNKKNLDDFTLRVPCAYLPPYPIFSSSTFCWTWHHSDTIQSLHLFTLQIIGASFSLLQLISNNLLINSFFSFS